MLTAQQTILHCANTAAYLHAQGNAVTTPHCDYKWSVYAVTPTRLPLPLLNPPHRLEVSAAMQAALCTLLGSAASYAYLVLMQRQVDAVSSTDEVPIWNAEDNVQGVARPFAIGLAAYRLASCILQIGTMHAHMAHSCRTLCASYKPAALV